MLRKWYRSIGHDRDCFQKSFSYSFNAGTGQTEFGNVGVSGGGSQTRDAGREILGARRDPT